VATAYTLFYIPYVNGELFGLAVFKLRDGRGPVERYIIWLNAAICVLLVLVAGMRSDVVDEWWAVWLLPPGEFIIALPYASSFNECIAVFIVIITARKTMFGVNVDELERLKYHYKGA